METDFKLFDPRTDAESSIPDVPGNYLIALREGCQLPSIGVIPVFKELEYGGKAYRIAYTGVSEQSLRRRDYHQHFTGNNAGRSTLRKSIGCMMGLRKVPRDVNKPQNGKTKFADEDERMLSEWMRDNLVVFYAVCERKNVKAMEKKHIGTFAPPLNIKDNPDKVNEEFRNELCRLRRNK